ncbi:MAG TPA: alpha/beta hydrolase [Gaiellaceae bacterium]|nr:alpha/beta hydrolase [Gaiellaceae bacterium]
MLHAEDFGGSGPPVLLLHGLAGYAGEWAESASWLRERHRVVALDQRGHGASVRVPAVVTPEAFVSDVRAWADALQLTKVALLGQSFGGLIALLTAASQPGRVERLVVAEASPAPDPLAEAILREWLESWPAPFPDESSAVRFFGGDSLRARSWVRGLDAREDGLWPRFDRETMRGALRTSAGEHWKAWDSIRCPTLVVRGEHGMPLEDAETMAGRLSRVVVATVPAAGHDVHLERPAEWRGIVEPFLAAGGS